MNEWTIVELVTASITGKKKKISFHVRFSEMENVGEATVPWLQLRNIVMFNNRGKFTSRHMLEHQCTWQGKESILHRLQNLLSSLKSFWNNVALNLFLITFILCFGLVFVLISGNSQIYFSWTDLKNCCYHAISHCNSYKPLSCWEHLPGWGNVPLVFPGGNHRRIQSDLFLLNSHSLPALPFFLSVIYTVEGGQCLFPGTCFSPFWEDYVSMGKNSTTSVTSTPEPQPLQ